MIKAVKGNRLPVWKGKDYTNCELNGWVILGMHSCIKNPSGSNYHTLWRVKCIGCGKESLNYKNNIVYGKSAGCRLCYRRRYLGNKGTNWRGYKDIPATVVSRMVFNAKARNLEVKVGIKDLQNLWEKSKGICTLSGLQIEIGKTASLDRIDSHQPYVLDNLQWVHKDIQKMKNDLPQERFVELCHVVSSHL